MTSLFGLRRFILSTGESIPNRRRLVNSLLRPQSAHGTSRWIVTATRVLLEKKTFMVPTMGDSITEGTIVEWSVQVGQFVKTDEVVALIETDKVTVEIKAEQDGVVTQQHGAVDETVEVGARLYEIDTEAEATVTASDQDPTTIAAETTTAAPPSTATSTVQPVIKTTPSSPPASQLIRAPSIHFLGKEGWAARKAGHEQTQANQALASPSGPTKPYDVTIVEDESVRHPMYGRPPFTDEEMDALIWGGANLVAEWKLKH